MYEIKQIYQVDLDKHDISALAEIIAKKAIVEITEDSQRIRLDFTHENLDISAKLHILSDPKHSESWEPSEIEYNCLSCEIELFTLEGDRIDFNSSELELKVEYAIENQN